MSTNGSEQKRILIVEDEENTIMSLEYILHQEGYFVNSLPNGRTAYEHLLEVDPNYYSIIISDIEMPEMNGKEMLKALKKKDIFIPTLIITGYGDKKLIQELLRIGCDDFLDKPFSRKDVIDAISRIIQKEKLKPNPTKNLESQIDSAKKAHTNIMGNVFSKRMNLALATKPLFQLGGDFFQTKENDHTFFALIADVAGHDMGSSYHTVILKTVFESCDIDQESPKEFLTKLNNMLLDISEEKRMICGLAIKIDTKLKQSTICSSCIPEATLIRKDNKLNSIPNYTSAATGLFPDINLVEESFPFEPGDRLYMYTDGITESARIDGPTGSKETLGINGLISIINKNKDLLPQKSVDQILDNTLQYCKYKQKDDYLVACIEYPEEG